MTRLDVIAGVERRECVAYRLIASRAGRRRVLGEVDPSRVDEAKRKWQAAMRGWSVTAEMETFRRWVTGGDDETSGRGGYGTAPRPDPTTTVPSTVPTVPKETQL